MELLMDINRWVHVIFGFTGLAAFWVPVLTRKGGHHHRLFGKVFKYCAYVVLIGALAAVALHFTQGLLAGETPRSAPGYFAFLVFLGYLALVTLVGLRHGLLVLSHKPDLATMNTPFNRAMAWAAVASSVVLVTYTAIIMPPNAAILFALSPIGIAGGFGILKALRGRRRERRAWMYEHMGNMLGTGIAFHTAFAVFGSQRLFDLGLTGWTAVIPWILPALVGIPAISLWTRHYQRRYRDLPA